MKASSLLKGDGELDDELDKQRGHEWEERLEKNLWLVCKLNKKFCSVCF